MAKRAVGALLYIVGWVGSGWVEWGWRGVWDVREGMDRINKRAEFTGFIETEWWSADLGIADFAPQIGKPQRCF
jgi:hypothetical protein